MKREYEFMYAFQGHGTTQPYEREWCNQTQRYHGVQPTGTMNVLG